ncbi:aspartyl-tRNA synthetase [Heterostelium album PN500]|uniref:aspartate--tRNA ligase n=1 Tax=Heterostelium pallidum (strain ATCC 26659 / Pp 5 / PN500) TaxID=670386 RepID=D3BEH3_HETP5|nr:aspartyl-tRNA synthetase [Heterostelium album PN500]EFA80304.1 aspartyl-tRNA synthetase [Heterostelium album PN500]|eukprot:XP_020432424.1 aspartyl-tRNA synthetase [Heterostelium album PN500]
MSETTPTTEVPTTSEAGEEKKSKKALNKELKKQQKEEKKNAAKAAKPQQQQQVVQNPLETSGDNFGRAPMNQSQNRAGKKYTPVESINPSLNGEKVLVRARVHLATATGSLAFMVLRDAMHTIQAVLSAAGNGKPMVKFAGAIPKESIVDMEATVITTKEPINRCTQKDVELQVLSLFIVSEAQQLPLQLEDLARPTHELEQQKKTIEELDEKLKSLTLSEAERSDLEKKKGEANKYAEVLLDTRLNNRVLDLRVPSHQAIFRLQSAVGMLFREYLHSNNFVEIHTPKMISSASESGASVFKLGYFDTNAYLAQSPQFYKQMAICSDMERVYEIGPVFRAENSFTHRHLTEFVGLDIEMSFREHYHEVLDVLDNLMCSIFEGLETRFAKELETIKAQYGYEPFKFTRPSPRFTFDEAAAMLNEIGETVVDNDINTTQEKLLGKIIKKKYGVDFYIIDKFYRTARPFYTMPDPNNELLANAYDLFMRGEEICSGAQRIHDAKMLEESAAKHGINIPSIQAYIDAFKYGAAPHAGGGVGLERVVMLYLGIGNIRKTSMFPRDPKRIAP